MADEQKRMFEWAPHTPARSVPAKHESNSTESTKVLKNGTPKRKNQKAKRQRPKVYDATLPKKKPSPPKSKPKKRPLAPELINPSTPKPRATKRPKTSVEPSKDIDQEEVGDSNAKFHKKKLDFDDQNRTMHRNWEVFDKIVPNFPLKKARMRRRRVTTFHKFSVAFNTREHRKAADEPINLGQLARMSEIVPNFPLQKKARMRRRRATTFHKFSVAFNAQKYRKAANETINLDQLTRKKRSSTPVRRKRSNIALVTVQDLIEHPELPHDNAVVSSNSDITSNGDIQHLEDVVVSSNSNNDDIPNETKSKLSHVIRYSRVVEMDLEDVVTSDDEEYDYLRDYNLYTKAMVDYSIKKMESLNINIHNQQLVLRNQSNTIIVPKEKSVPTKKPTPKLVDIDAPIGRDENNAYDDKMAKERELFESRILGFISSISRIQGDRKFSPWKGSVVDSIVGVILTQNVTDNLSSQVFMYLASIFPGDEVEHEQLLLENDPSHTRHVDPEQLSLVEKDPMFCSVSQTQVDPESENVHSSSKTKRKNKGKKDEEDTSHWDKLRVQYSTQKNRTYRNRDFVNWEAVRQMSPKHLADVIVERGMCKLLSKVIKEFLDRIFNDHGSTNLEWLRDVPPQKAMEYLLSIHGLGPKSVHCVMLLSLNRQAFPVDVNIARVASRLGWITLLLPPEVPMHLLNLYPKLDDVQKFFWRRILNMSHQTLYEAHCHLILFGKSICTHRKPNCGACPFKVSCKHYASLIASHRPLLESSHEVNMANQSSEFACSQGSMEETSPLMLPGLDGDLSARTSSSQYCEPIIEMPESPVHECTDAFLQDIEDMESEDEIPMLNLCSGKSEHYESKALITVNMVATHPMPPPLKNKKRLRTEHHVYELPDSHPLLAGFEKREPEEKCMYLLAIWMPKISDGSQESKSAEVVKYQDERIVQGTILIPCRTANRGFFPLNGTYFQINEVFADHESSHHPIDVPREWVWNLNRRTLYCATSVSSVCRDMLEDEMSYFFNKGAMCIRGFDRKNRAPKPLERKFHVSTINK